MAWRKIDQLVNSTVGVIVTVHYDTETKEFRVSLMGHPESDYFTDDRLDACATKNLMFDREVKDRLEKLAQL